MTDHSMAAAAGVKHEKALPAMFRGVVTRAVGLEDEVDLEETPLKVEKGDFYILCSDGLSKMVPDRKMQKLINSLAKEDVRVIGRQLIEAANAAGGDDNISVALVRVVGDLPAGPMEAVEDLEEVSTSETALELPTPGDDEMDDSAEDYAGHTPDSRDSLVGVTPGTGETTPAGAALAPTEATVRATAAAEKPVEVSLSPPSQEAVTPSSEPVTPDTNTTDGAGDSRATPTDAPAKPAAPTNAPWLKIGAAAVVLIGVVGIVLSLRGKPPGATDVAVAPAVSVEPAPESPAVSPAEPAPVPAEPEPVPEPAEPAVAPPEEPAPPAEPVPPAEAVAVEATPEPEVADETPESVPVPPTKPEPVEPAVPAEPAEPEAPAPQEAPVEPSPVAEPETVSPEAAIQQLAPQLVAQMPRSLTTGTWGELLPLLEPIEPHLDLANKEVDGLRNSLIWVEEWKKAGADGDYATRNLTRCTDVVAGLLLTMGYDEIPGGRPTVDASVEGAADAYCRELFRLRQILVSRLRALLSEMQAQVRVLGKNPDQTLMRLHAFMHTPADANRETAAAWTRAVADLDAWLAQDSDTLIPLVGFMKGPPQVVPELIARRATMWTGLMVELEAGKDDVEKWKQSKGRTPVLIQIDRMRATVVRRYQAGQAENARIRWPIQDDLNNLETLLTNISGFMARE